MDVSHATLGYAPCLTATILDCNLILIPATHLIFKNYYKLTQFVLSETHKKFHKCSQNEIFYVWNS